MDVLDQRDKFYLRSALEYSFKMSVNRNDDGILKYTLRYIDQKGLSDDHWDVVEPFLKRSAAHFGHTIDYVTRILAWRHLARGDLNINGWKPILETILDAQGSLGNDSEVCWTLYLYQLFELEITLQCATSVVRNCGPLALVSLLNCDISDPAIFNISLDRLKTETEEDTGRYWPVYLEWKSKEWPYHEDLNISNSTLRSLVRQQVIIYDRKILPAVFHDFLEDEFDEIDTAIESHISIYDEDEIDENDEVDSEY